MHFKASGLIEYFYVNCVDRKAYSTPYICKYFSAEKMLLKQSVFARPPQQHKELVKIRVFKYLF